MKKITVIFLVIMASFVLMTGCGSSKKDSSDTGDTDSGDSDSDGIKRYDME